MQTGKSNVGKRLFKAEESVLVMALIILVIIMSFASPYFLTTKNLMNVLNQASVIFIAAIGMTILILIGEIDLSIGSLAALVGILTVKLLNIGGSIIISVIVGILVACFVSFITVSIINRYKIPSLIVTLGMMTIIRGICLLITNAVAVQIKNPSFTVIGTGYISIIPIPVIISVVLFVAFNYMLNKTVLGRNIYATGGNEGAAIAAGINTKKLKRNCFILSGMLVAVSAIILTARVNSGQPNLAEGFEFTVISATVLGGASLLGGQGSLSGTVVGILILQVLENGMILLDISSFWQKVVSGFVIILAVVLDAKRKENSNKVKKKAILAMENK